MSNEINHGILVQPKNKPIELNQNKIDDRQYIPQKYKDVASGMEQQFAEYMINQMNNSIDKADADETPGMDYYKGLQTTEQAKIMAHKNTLGLQNVILDQIYPKRLRNEIALKQYEAQADRIHHNLPKLVTQPKNDKIIMGKNDSPPLDGNSNVADQNKEGGLK